MVERGGGEGFLWSAAVVLLLGLVRPSAALSHLNERASYASGSWGGEQLFLGRHENDLSLYSPWNITGKYRDGILLGGILVVCELHNFLCPILFIMYSFWIPQIVTNVIGDTRKALHPHYIAGMTLTRLAVPFYIFGCPSNFLQIEVDRYWCIYLGVFMGLQALILLLQHYLGSPWFIPHQILPEQYCYYRKFENDASTDWVICMTAIDFAEHSNGGYMVTPCDHCFHSGCLLRWMDIKMECPTCRRTLPSA